MPQMAQLVLLCMADIMQTSSYNCRKNLPDILGVYSCYCHPSDRRL